MRYTIIDGWRGFFLVFMVVVHVNETFHALIGKLNHHAFGWVQDAQGFVFISGLVVGMTGMRALARGGPAALGEKVSRRISGMYRCHVTLILTFLTVASIVPGAAFIPSLAPYVVNGETFTAASVLLIAASNDMGILPMYIYFMALTPLVLRCFANGYTGPVLTVSLALWLLGQTGLVHLAGDWLEGRAAATGVPIKLGLYFNLFSWQILFVAGLFFGSRWTEGRLDLGWLRQRQHEYGFIAALLIIVLLGLFRRMVYDFWISPEFSEGFLAANNRQDLTAIYLLAFAVDLYAVAWLFVAGPTSRFAAIRRLAAGGHWLFSRRCLVFLGEHSLEVFTFHLLIVYFVCSYFADRPVGAVEGNLYVVLCVAALYLPAWWHARERRQVHGLSAAG